MSDREDHRRDLASLRRRLARHFEVVGVLDLTPLDESGPEELTTRVAFTPRVGDRGVVGHVLVDTSEGETECFVAGWFPLDPGEGDVPPDVPLDGVSNAELLALDALARERPELVTALEHAPTGVLMGGPWDLVWSAARTEAEDVRAVALALRSLADGAPLEWVTRRLVAARRPEGDS